MRITLKDIAREVNMSVTTVSLVLNNKNCRISTNSKKLIWDTAKRLNYYPNQIAVGLVKNETKTIGLIIPDISNHFFSSIVLGVDDEIHKHNRNIVLSNTSDKPERDISNINSFLSRGVDAIILAMASEVYRENIQVYKEIIENSSIPFITVDRYHPTLNCSSIRLNNKKGAFNAITHLLSLGHKNIVCITGPINLKSTLDRLSGYQWAFEEAGIPLPAKYLFLGNYLYSGGIEATEQILAETKATAIFAFNDLMAYGTYHVLTKHGLSVPSDISVVGFDDIDFSDILDVPLTTIRQPSYEIGQEAAKRAIIEIENPRAEKQNISFEPDLVIRKSTAAPKVL